MAIDVAFLVAQAAEAGHTCMVDDSGATLGKRQLSRR